MMVCGNGSSVSR